MKPIIYVNRTTGLNEQEQVYGAKALSFIYGGSFLGTIAQWLVVHLPFLSQAYGLWQKTRFSKKKIDPFIEAFHIDRDEFLSPAAFDSFNSFFIRKLKPKSRPISPSPAVIPADGRYYFYQQIEDFSVKGHQFNLTSLLQDPALAERYRKGSMLIARRCPSDYHRFHFPCDCTPSPVKLINGYLYSVNPLAVRQNLRIYTENKRCVTMLNRTPFGQVAYVEIGATNVGSIIQTYQPGIPYVKGAEKGYFSFGGSALILLFEPDSIRFDADLVRSDTLEIRCLTGQSLGTFLK